MTGYSSLYTKLGYTFKDQAILLAVLHRKSVSEGGIPNFQALENLGDTKLSALLTEHLILRTPALEVGALHQLREPLKQNAGKLLEVARGLGLRAYLQGPGLSGNVDNLLADAVEALLGAIWWDACRATAQGSGAEAADRALRQVIHKLWSLSDADRSPAPAQAPQVAPQAPAADPDSKKVFIKKLLRMIRKGKSAEVAAWFREHPQYTVNVRRSERHATPLIIAVLHRQWSMVRIFLAQGADKTCKAKSGKTAHDFAALITKASSAPPADLLARLHPAA